jgi:uncharacterized membrane-anchored protein YitT (DUF2179 family)
MKQQITKLVSGFDFQAACRDWFYLTSGALLLIASVDIFLAPAKLSPGGVTGIAIIINEFTGWPIGLIMLILNIPMMALGFHYLGRFRFLTSTLYVVLLFNLGVDYAARWLPPGITDDLLLNALYSGVVGGVGMGLVYRGRGTSAGTGVLGRVLQLKTGIPLSQVYLLTDGGVILVGGLIFGWEVALYSFLTLFVWGVVTDYVLEGPSVIRTAFIITDSPVEVTQAVFERLGLGITAWTGKGMFTDSQHTVLFCTINRPDVNTLKAVITEVDPYAFVVIGQGHQATGGVLRPARREVKPLTRVRKLAAKV